MRILKARLRPPELACIWGSSKHQCATLDTLMQDLTGCGEGANLALLFMHIDANILHGWSPLSAA